MPSSLPLPHPGSSSSPPARSITVGPNATNVNFAAFAAYVINGLSVGAYSNGVLQLAFAGTNGQREAVEVSTDLKTWIPVSTNVLGPDGLWPFSLTNTLAQPAQFLRARTR